MSFIQNFWPQENNFKSSLDKLDTRLHQSISENEQIILFLTSRISIEETYGRSMKELSEKKRQLLSRPVGFDINPDDGASLSHAFSALKVESVDLGQEHLKLSEELKEKVLKPLEDAHKEHHGNYIKNKEFMLSRVNLFEKSNSVVEIARRNYIEKCKNADKLEEAAISVAQKKEEEGNQIKKGSVTYIFGKLNLSEPDLKAFLIKAQSEGTSQDSKSMFLGLFRGLQSGEAIVQWLLHAYSNELKTPADAAEVGQALIDQNFLRLIGPGSQFKLAPTAFYQWKKRADEYEEGEPPHYQARKAADEADKHYQNAVNKCDDVRTKLEEATYRYLIEMEKNEESRIQSIKKAFLALSQIETKISSNVTSIIEQLQPHFDSLKPQQDVALMAETLAVGPFRPCVIVYHNHYHGPGLDQRFGVSIDALARISKVAVSPTISLLLESLERVAEGQPALEKFPIWCCDSTLEEVHRCRDSINNPNAQLSDLFGYEAGVLASTLRLFLQELPDSLIPSSLYDKLKSICTEVDDEERCNDLSICFNDLSIPQRATLHAILQPLKSMVSNIDSKDPQFQRLTLMYAPCILRPPDHQAVGSFHHRHPHKMFKDLLFCDSIISVPEPKEITEWLATPSANSQIKEKTEQSSDVIFINMDDDDEVLSQPESNAKTTAEVQPKEKTEDKFEPVPKKEENINPPPPAESHEEDYLDLDLEDLGDNVIDDSNTNDPIDLKDDFFDDV